MNSFKTALIIPIIVGILVATFTFTLPKIFSSRKEISYSVDGPTSYINAQAGAPVSIIVNGVQTPTLFIYRVRLWNSSGTPVANLSVLFSFTPRSPGFQIFNLSHATIPEKEFGKIEETNGDPQSKRCTYELLNPGDQDTLTFLASSPAPLGVFAKAEGLKVTAVTQKEGNWSAWSSMIAVGSAMVAIVSSIITLALKRLSQSKTWPFY